VKLKPKQQKAVREWIIIACVLGVACSGVVLFIWLKWGDPQKAVRSTASIAKAQARRENIGAAKGETAPSPSLVPASPELTSNGPLKFKAGDVVIVKWSWQKAGFGNVMEADFTIKNTTGNIVKDVEIKCVHTAPSGTVIDSNERTIYERWEPGETRTIIKFNMGFIHDQAKSSTVVIKNCVLTFDAAANAKWVIDSRKTEAEKATDQAVKLGIIVKIEGAETDGPVVYVGGPWNGLDADSKENLLNAVGSTSFAIRVRQLEPPTPCVISIVDIVTGKQIQEWSTPIAE
jgi:hypothetical protein